MQLARKNLNLKNLFSIYLLLLFTVYSDVTHADWHAYEGKKLRKSELGLITQQSEGVRAVIVSVDGARPKKWHKRVYVPEGKHTIRIEYYYVSGSTMISSYTREFTTITSVEDKDLELQIDAGHTYSLHALGDPFIPTHFHRSYGWDLWIKDETIGEIAAGKVITEHDFLNSIRADVVENFGTSTPAGVTYADGRFLDLGNGTIRDTMSGLAEGR